MRRAAALLLLCALTAAGCGLGAGEEQEGGAELRVTRDFGRERLGVAREDKLREDQTVMRLLRSSFDVETRYGGRFVQELKGLSGEGADGQTDWFYFVNGFEASVGASDFELSPGDVVQWDYRRWDGAMRVPAIVGAFPEPFRHGRKGERFPIRVECADAEGAACREVKRRLEAAGIRTSGAALGATGTENVLRVVVAPWQRAKLVQAVAALDGEPQESGVFARFRDDGRRLELLDAGGEVAREAPEGTGLVAALAPEEETTIWLVTGVDEQGVEAAAEALGEKELRDAYAVAATPSGVEELPLR